MTMSNPFDSIMGSNRGNVSSGKARPLQRGEKVRVNDQHELEGSIGVVKSVREDGIVVQLRRQLDTTLIPREALDRVMNEEPVEFVLTEDIQAVETKKMEMPTDVLVQTPDGNLVALKLDGGDNVDGDNVDGDSASDDK
jgi:hypothetical protein